MEERTLKDEEFYSSFLIKQLYDALKANKPIRIEGELLTEEKRDFLNKLLSREDEDCCFGEIGEEFRIGSTMKDIYSKKEEE